MDLLHHTSPLYTYFSLDKALAFYHNTRDSPKPADQICRPTLNAVLASVQAALEPAAFAEAFAAGQQMTLEEAFATILSSAYIEGPSTRDEQLVALVP